MSMKSFEETLNTSKLDMKQVVDRLDIAGDVKKDKNRVFRSIMNSRTKMYQQNEFVDNTSTLASIEVGVPDRFEKMLSEQALIDNSLDFIPLSKLGRLKPKKVPKKEYLPVDAPITTKPSPRLEKMLGKKQARELWLREEAAKRGKYYALPNEKNNPSKLYTGVKVASEMTTDPRIVTGMTVVNTRLNNRKDIDE